MAVGQVEVEAGAWSRAWRAPGVGRSGTELRITSMVFLSCKIEKSFD
jgi:hypothetical protein